MFNPYGGPHHSGEIYHNVGNFNGYFRSPSPHGDRIEPGFDSSVNDYQRMLAREMERGRSEGERYRRQMAKDFEVMGREFEWMAEERQRGAEERRRAAEERQRAKEDRQKEKGERQREKEERQRDKEERQRDKERAKVDKEKARARMHASSLHAPESVRSKSRSTSRKREDNTVHVTLDGNDADGSHARLIDLLTREAAASGGNINIHVVSNPYSLPGATSGTARSPARASSSATGPTSAGAANHRRAPPPNPTQAKPSTSTKPRVISPQLKKAHDLLEYSKMRLEKLTSDFVFPLVVDFQQDSTVVSVDVTQNVEEIVAASVARDGLDVDLAEVEVDDILKLKLAYTSSNLGLLNYLEALDKLVLRLDGIESNGDEDVRLRRRKLVKEVEAEVEKVERFWRGVWKKEGVEDKKQATSGQNVNVETEAEPDVIIENLPIVMGDRRPTPQPPSEPTLTIEPPVEEVIAMQIAERYEESLVHVERPDSVAAFTSDVKVDSDLMDHTQIESDDWIDIPSSSSLSARSRVLAGTSSNLGVDLLTTDVDWDDEPPSYELTMSVTSLDGRPDDPVNSGTDGEAVGQAGKRATSMSTSNSPSAGKDKKVKLTHQLHVVNGDGEQDAEWIPVDAKGL